MIRRRILFPFALVALLATSACRSPNEPHTTPTTTTAEPVTVDEETVGRVLTDLDRVQGDVLRRIVDRGSVGHDDLLPLEAVFLEPELTAQLEAYAGLGDRLDLVRKPPGDNRTTVVRLLSARPDCIYAEVSVDVAPTVVTPVGPFTSFVALRPLPAGADAADVNPSPYGIAAKHQVAADPCG